MVDPALLVDGPEEEGVPDDGLEVALDEDFSEPDEPPVEPPEPEPEEPDDSDEPEESDDESEEPPAVPLLRLSLR